MRGRVVLCYHADVRDIILRVELSPAVEALLRALVDRIASAPAPPRAQGMAGVPAQRAPRGSLWTLARDAVVREGWPAGTPTRDLRDAVNALPGGYVRHTADVSRRAFHLGLRRPPGTDQMAAVRARLRAEQQR